MNKAVFYCPCIAIFGEQNKVIFVHRINMAIDDKNECLQTFQKKSAKG